MSETAVSIPSDDQKKARWREDLVALVTQQENRFRAAKDRWNFWYYSSMYGAVLCSALSALVLKLEMERLKGAWQTDVAALLATLAAILGTATSTGNFERRWANFASGTSNDAEAANGSQEPNCGS